MTRQKLPNRRRSKPGRYSNSPKLGELELAFVFEFESHKYRATASRFADGRLAEIFLDTDKAGTPLQLNAETAAILASLCLQHGVDVETIRHSVNGPIAIALAEFSEGE